MGVVQDVDRDVIPTSIGTQQGEPLSPLLSNILLDRLDKELEGRKVRFARYAYDTILLTKRLCDAKMILKEISGFLERKMKLVVNQDKTKVAKMTECGLISKLIGSRVRYQTFRKNMILFCPVCIPPLPFLRSTLWACLYILMVENSTALIYNTDYT